MNKIKLDIDDTYVSIPNTEYRVSPNGNVVNKNDKKIGSMINNHLYFRLIDLEGNKKIVYVSRLIAEMFIPNPDNKKYVININGDTNNNSVDNLKWADRKEIPVTTLGQAKINKVQAEEIRVLLKDGVKYKTIQEMYGLSLPTLYLIKNNKTWK